MRRLAGLAFALLIILVIILILARTCGPSTPAGPAPTPVADEQIDPAPWESAWAPDEADLWREGAVTEHVVDASPSDPVRPVAGARVTLLTVSPDGLRTRDTGIAVTTGSDGRFRLGPVPRRSWVLVVTKPGFTRTTLGGGRGTSLRGVAEPPPDLELRVGLRPAHDIAGRVVDQAGKPLAGVRVVASTMAYLEDDLVTDADGRFVAHAPEGPVVFEVDDPRVDLVRKATVIEAGGAVHDVTIATRLAEPVRGTVQSLEGMPLAGSIVLSVEDPAIRTRTDRDGAFELRIPRHHHIAALVGGYGWRASALPRAGGIDLMLSPSPGAIGVVVDPEGRPVEDARLVAVVLGYTGSFERVIGPRTAADGSFRFSWLPTPPRGSVTPVRFLALKRGLGETAIVSPMAATSGLAERFGLGLMGTRDASGSYRHPDGTPVAAAVEAKWGHWDGGISPLEAAALGLEEKVQTMTDAHGYWRLTGIPLGLHALIRAAVGGVAQERTVDDAPPGNSFDFVLPGGNAIAGRVVPSSGKPIEGTVSVTAELLNAVGTQLKKETVVDAAGAFRFDDIPAGSYQIIARGDAYDLPGGKVVDSGNTAVEVPITHSATLKVRLSFEGGEAPDVALAYRILPGGGGSGTRTDTIPAGGGGDVPAFEGLDLGPWTFELSGDVWRAAVHVDLADGDVREIEVPVRRTIRIVAKLLGPDGNPMAGQHVVYAPVAGSSGPTETKLSAADGTVDLTGLTPGRWHAESTPLRMAPVRVDFDVVPGPNPPLELRVPGYGTLFVHVSRDVGGLPLRDATVSLTDPEGRPVEGWGEGATQLMNRFSTNEEGNVRVEGVRAGKIHVETEIGGSLLKVVDEVITAGRQTKIDVP